jgi:hypothetical protein
LRRELHLPFWEALLLASFGSEGSERLLEESLYHQSHRAQLKLVSRADVLAGALRASDYGSPARPISLSSLLTFDDGTDGHLPMLDFHCPESDANDRLVARACRLLFVGPVFVLASGESYHGIASTPVAWADLQRLLIKSLLAAPVVDSRYVAHQLLEGACALRISPSLATEGPPTVKMVLEA